MPTVRVGDRDLTVTAFSSFKFLEATDILGRLLDVVPELDTAMADFANEYAQRHPPRTLDRVTAELRFGEAAKAIGDDVWAAQGNELTITPRPTGPEIGLRIFPIIAKHARKDFVRLMALVITPNSELEEADEAGQDLYAGEGPVAKWQRHLLHKGTPTQMIAVGMAAIEVLADEINAGDLASAVGNLMGRWNTLTGATQPTEKPSPKKTPRARSARGGQRSSTSSSPRTREDSPAATSSTA